MRPRVAPGVSCRELPDGECVLLAADGSRALVLNPVGAVVWQLCDGVRRGDDIAGVIAGHFRHVDPASVRRDVGAVLDELARAQLIEDLDSCSTT